MQLIGDLYKDCFIPDAQWDNLRNLAISENWDYLRDPSSFKYPILRNYIFYTYKRLVDLQNENSNKIYILSKGNFICFNTGLLTKNYEEIFMVWQSNRIPDKQKWYSLGFFKESDRKILNLGQFPLRAHYIRSLSDLIIDTNLEIVPNLDHIFEDEENIKRIPEDLRDLPLLVQCFKGALETTIRRLKANYKLAVPHFYNNKMQLLLPISLKGTSQPDVVLTVEKVKNVYRGTTCLTLDMAYNNARLIAKPETDWLIR